MTRNAVFHSAGSFDDGSPITVFPAAVASVFGRTGAVAAVAGDYFGAMPAALTGATQAARFVGATTSGAPASGTFAVGDVVVARDGHVFVCTSAGTPGTWVDVGAGAGVSSINKTGSTALTGAVTLTGGTNVTLTQSGQDISIAATGTGGTQGTEIGYDQITSNVSVTSTSESSGTTIITCSAYTFDGAAVIAEFFSPQVILPQATAAFVFLIVSLWESTTQIGRIAVLADNEGTGTLAAVASTLRSAYRFTPSAGSHTYVVKAHVSGTVGTPAVNAGSGGTGAIVPAFMRFTKV